MFYRFKTKLKIQAYFQQYILANGLPLGGDTLPQKFYIKIFSYEYLRKTSLSANTKFDKIANLIKSIT